MNGIDLEISTGVSRKNLNGFIGGWTKEICQKPFYIGENVYPDFFIVTNKDGPENFCDNTAFIYVNGEHVTFLRKDGTSAKNTHWTRDGIIKYIEWGYFNIVSQNVVDEWFKGGCY